MLEPLRRREHEINYKLGIPYRYEFILVPIALFISLKADLHGTTLTHATSLRQAHDMTSSLRSNRFRGAKSEEMGFSEFCPGEKWGESKNKKEVLRSPHFSRGQNSFARRSRWISGFSFPYISGFPKRTGTLATQAI